MSPKQQQQRHGEGDAGRLEANIVRLPAWMWEVLRERKAETGESLSFQVAHLLEAAFKLERGERYAKESALAPAKNATL